MTEAVLHKHETLGYHEACEKTDGVGYLVNLGEDRLALIIPTIMGREWWHWVVFDTDGFEFSIDKTATSRMPFTFDRLSSNEIPFQPVDDNPFLHINETPQNKPAFAEHLYIIQSVRGGPVKIGRSSDPASRLETLQVGSPFKLVVVRVYENEGVRESEVHLIVKKHRTHGEWFDEEVIQIVDALSSAWGCK